MIHGTRFARLGDLVSARPIVDHFIPIAAVLLWFFSANGFVPASETARISIFTGVATVSGLAMAASTFACSMTYQSANILMAEVRQVFSKALQRNWVAIISSALVTAVVPLASIAIDSVNAQLAFASAIYCAGLLTARFFRSLWWLQYTLFMQSNALRIPAREIVPLRSDLRSGRS